MRHNLYAGGLPKHYTETWSEQMLLERCDVAIRLAPHKVNTDLQCVKQRAIKGGGLVYVGSIYSPTLGETVLGQVKVFFFFFLNWRITALQCFVGFYRTSTRISHNYIYIPSPPPIPPKKLVFRAVISQQCFPSEIKSSCSAYCLVIRTDWTS